MIDLFSLCCHAAVFVLFFQYYTHIMYLPLINGAAEGCFAVGFFILISAVMGTLKYLSII